MTSRHPDGWTFEAITALQQEVDEELRREGYPVLPWLESVQRTHTRTAAGGAGRRSGWTRTRRGHGARSQRRTGPNGRLRGSRTSGQPSGG
jgi:hypothetical protein